MIHEHGYVELVESWGSDERVIEAARMSTQKGFEGWGPIPCAECGGSGETEEDGSGSLGYRVKKMCARCKGAKTTPGDEKLLAYLWKNRHETPFEMAGMIVEVRAPIFVFREWHRHRVPWGYNEASARYSPLPALDYIPSVERLLRGGGHLTKQAAASDGAAEMNADTARWFRAELADVQQRAEHLYSEALRRGVPKELARLSMTVGRYSTMRATCNLRGWLHFLGLRAHPKAQEEIRIYAEACHGLLSKLFPRTLALFDERT